MKKEHIEVIKTLSTVRNWSRHKTKSIRGQVLSIKDDTEREQYLKKIIRKERREP